MGKFNEDAFEATTEIVAAYMEEAEVEMSAKGGDQVADFFAAIYNRLFALAEGVEDAAKKPGAFEVYRDKQGEHRFRLKAANGETIAVSEGYEKKEACLKGVESVKKHAAGATVKELDPLKAD